MVDRTIINIPNQIDRLIRGHITKESGINHLFKSLLAIRRFQEMLAEIGTAVINHLGKCKSNKETTMIAT